MTQKLYKLRRVKSIPEKTIKKERTFEIELKFQIEL
jgi:hypothetical protein